MKIAHHVIKTLHYLKLIQGWPKSKLPSINYVYMSSPNIDRYSKFFSGTGTFGKKFAITQILK